MLEEEGFAFDRYIDIFDGGPTVTARHRRDPHGPRIAMTRRSSRSATAATTKMLLAHGRLKDFVACFGTVKRVRRRASASTPRRAELLGVEGRRRGAGGGALMALRRDQFRRDRRAEPQLCRAEPRQSRLDPQRRPGVAAARGGAAGHRQDARQPRARPGAGPVRAAPAAQPRRGWPSSARPSSEADPALAANAMSASAMWAANAATVSPAPDTADGRCHLTVANLRTMPHRSHEWPATLAQLRLAFADATLSRCTARSRRRSATRARPTTCG